MMLFSSQLRLLLHFRFLLSTKRLMVELRGLKTLVTQYPKGLSRACPCAPTMGPLFPTSIILKGYLDVPSTSQLSTNYTSTKQPVPLERTFLFSTSTDSHTVEMGASPCRWLVHSQDQTASGMPMDLCPTGALQNVRASWACAGSWEGLGHLESEAERSQRCRGYAVVVVVTCSCFDPGLRTPPAIP